MGGGRGGGDIPIWPVGKHLWNKEDSFSRTSFLSPGFSICCNEDCDPEKELGTTCGVQLAEPTRIIVLELGVFRVGFCGFVSTFVVLFLGFSSL